MSKCPKCGSPVSFWQMNKHTRWHPIVCRNCNSKLHFNMKEYYKQNIPMFVCALLFFMISPLKRMNLYYYKITFIVILVMFLLLLIKNIKDFYSLKLEIKE